jgi:hypothetical protein
MTANSDHKLSFTNESGGRFFAIGVDVRISVPYSNYCDMVGKILEITSALVYISFDPDMQPLAFHFDEVARLLN